jgi:hypothetical protein
VLEILVVVFDGVAIKLLVMFDGFQGDEYRGVSWLRSLSISAVGNTLSYFVGYVATQQPWEKHDFE